MKLYIIGSKGWIGKKYINLCKQEGIEYITSEFRATTDDLLQDIVKRDPSHVISCIGRTHGIRNGKKYSTIDYLEHDDKLSENINDNLFAPLSLAMFCQTIGIHFTYIGTGCIFNYDNNHLLNESSIQGEGYKEIDDPNFIGSKYSLVKGYTDKLMKFTNALVLRIRMPITDEIHPRNFITKITSYEKICSIPNSMSVLNNLLPISLQMMKDKVDGTFNFTNPGVISHNEILEMYKDIVDKNFKWNNFTIEEQSQILLGGRSNNYLDTNKLESMYKVKPIKEAVMDVLTTMKNNKKLIYNLKL